MDRVAIFIDGQNLHYGLEDCVGINQFNLNFTKFLKLLCKERSLVRAYYYVASVSQPPKPDPLQEQMFKVQQRLFSQLRQVPYLEVKRGRLEPRPSKSKGQTIYQEKGVDVNLAVDMLHMGYNNHYDVAVLVSGDGDFAPVIQAVKSIPKHVEVAYFYENRRKAFALMDVCDLFITLSHEFLKDCIIQKLLPFKRV